MGIIQRIKRVFTVNTKVSHDGPWENWQERWSDEKVDNVWGQKLRNKEWRMDPAYKLIADKCKEHGVSVVDLGSGGGLQYAALKEYVGEIDYIGIDITPRHVQFASEMFPEVRFEEGDAANLSFEDKAFDISLIRHVIEHHPKEKAEQILNEAFRVAAKCVLILFFIPPKEMEEDVIEKRKKSGFYLNTYSKKWIDRQIKEHGFVYETAIIKNSESSPALYDQELYVCLRQ